MTIYTVFETNTGALLATGTAKECAETLGFINEGSFRCAVYQVRDGINKRYKIEIHNKRDDIIEPIWHEEFYNRWRKIQKRFGV